MQTLIFLQRISHTTRWTSKYHWLTSSVRTATIITIIDKCGTCKYQQVHSLMACMQPTDICQWWAHTGVLCAVNMLAIRSWPLYTLQPWNPQMSLLYLIPESTLGWLEFKTLLAWTVVGIWTPGSFKGSRVISLISSNFLNTLFLYILNLQSINFTNIHNNRYHYRLKYFSLRLYK